MDLCQALRQDSRVVEQVGWQKLILIGEVGDGVVGMAVRAVQALSAHAFGALGLQRVEIVVAVGNHASEGVARRAGAQWECVARNRLQLHGAAVPASVFSLVP